MLSSGAKCLPSAPLQVTATEMNGRLVNLAQKNMAANSITNAKIAKMSSEDYSSTAAFVTGSVRKTHRRTLLVDPPRAGVDKATLELMHDFDTIVYISCNPSTCVGNIKALEGRFKVEKLALFD